MYSLNKKKYFFNKLFLGNIVLNIACLNPSQYTVEKINGWSQRLTEFNEFLNGTGDSVQSAIAGADEDTILKDLEDQQSRITRAATEIAALIQKFNSVITTENKASYRGV